VDGGGKNNGMNAITLSPLPFCPSVPLCLPLPFLYHFTQKVLNAAFFVLLLSSFAAAAPRSSVIQGIRTISSADATRVVISLSGPISYELVAEPSATVSTAPTRLHVRFSPAGLAPGVRTTAKVEDGLLKEVRTGLIEDSVIRVSLEVERLGTYRATRFRSPDQLVIQLRKQQHSITPIGLPPRLPNLTTSQKVVSDRQIAMTQSSPVPLPPASTRLSEKSSPQVITNEAKRGVREKEPPPSLPAPRHDTPLPNAQTATKNSEPAPSPFPSSLPSPPTTPTDRQAAIILPLPAPIRPPTKVEEPEPIPSPAQKRYRIMIDPGHGGSDPGTQSASGLQEKTVVLAVSKRLAQKLRARLGAEVALTRTTDVFIPLPERTARANAAKADLFISIHANASPNAETHGIETYYLNNTEDRATIRLAKLENGIRARQQLPQREASLSYILSDLIQTGKEEESISLAQAVQTALVNQARTAVPHANDLGVKKGPFYVLVGAHMPCILVELAFLSHATEAQRLGSTTYQETLAEGLYRGIAEFLRNGPSAKNL